MVAPQEMTLSSTAPLVKVNRDTCDDHLDLSVWQTPDQDYLLAIRGGPKAVFGDGGHLVRLCLTEDTPGTEAFSGRETGKGRIAVAGLVVYSNPPNTDLNNHTGSKHLYFVLPMTSYTRCNLFRVFLPCPTTQIHLLWIASTSVKLHTDQPLPLHDSCEEDRCTHWLRPDWPLETTTDPSLFQDLGLTYRSFAI